MSDNNFPPKTLSNYRSYKSPYLLNDKKSISSRNEDNPNYFINKYNKHTLTNIKKKTGKSYLSNNSIFNENENYYPEKRNFEALKNSEKPKNKRYMDIFEQNDQNSFHNSNFINPEEKEQNIRFFTLVENTHSKEFKSRSINREKNDNFRVSIDKFNIQKNQTQKTNSLMNSLEKNRYMESKKFVSSKNIQENPSKYISEKNNLKVEKDLNFKIMLLEKKNKNLYREIKKKNKEITGIRNMMFIDKESLQNIESEKEQLQSRLSEMDIKMKEMHHLITNLENENKEIKDQNTLNTSRKFENDNCRFKKKTSLSNKIDKNFFSTMFSEKLYGTGQNNRCESNSIKEIDEDYSQIIIENNLDSCQEKLKKIMGHTPIGSDDKVTLKMVLQELSQIKEIIKKKNILTAIEKQKPLYLSLIQKDLENIIRYINTTHEKGLYIGLEDQIIELKKNLSFFIKSNNKEGDSDLNDSKIKYQINRRLNKLFDLLNLEKSDLDKNLTIDELNLKAVENIIDFVISSNNFINVITQKNNNESYFSLKTFQNNISSIILEKEQDPDLIFETIEDNFNSDFFEQNIFNLKKDFFEIKKTIKTNIEKLDKIEKKINDLEIRAKNNKEDYKLRNIYLQIKQELNELMINEEDNKFELTENPINLKERTIKKYEEELEIKNSKLRLNKKVIKELESVIEELKKSLKDNYDNKETKRTKRVCERNSKSVLDIKEDEIEYSLENEKFSKSVLCKEEDLAQDYNSILDDNKSKMVNEIEDFIKELVEKHKNEKSELIDQNQKLLEENKLIKNELDDYKIHYQKLTIVNLHMTKIKEENSELKNKIIELEKLVSQQNYSNVSESDEDFESQSFHTPGKEEEIDKEKEYQDQIQDNIVNLINRMQEETFFFNKKESEEILDNFEEIIEKSKFNFDEKEKLLEYLRDLKTINNNIDIKELNEKIKTIETNLIKKKSIKEKLDELIKKLKTEKEKMTIELKNKIEKKEELENVKGNMENSSVFICKDDDEEAKLEEEFNKMQIIDVEHSLEFLNEEIESQKKKIVLRTSEIKNMEDYLKKNIIDFNSLQTQLSSFSEDKKQFETSLKQKKEIINFFVSTLL